MSSLVAGDFNYIMEPHKKIDGRHFADSVDSREFKRFIDDLG